MSTMTSLPACCSDPDDRWPWRQRLPDLQLVTLHFDASALLPEHFEHCGITPPESIRNAIAKRQAEYLAGRLCAREALQKVTGRPDIPGTDSDRAPQWPTHSVGSITHTHGHAAAIVGHQTDYAGLGIDLEVAISDQRAQKLATQILTNDEQVRFADAMQSSPGPFLTQVFSLKESLFKALYPITRQRFYFEHAEVISWTPEGEAELRLLKTLSPDWPAGSTLQGFVANRENTFLSLVPVSNKTHPNR